MSHRHTDGKANDVPVFYFNSTAEGLEPQPCAVSPWSPDMIIGPAICGALAHALDTEHSTDGFSAVRLTIDLFRPVRWSLLTLETTRVRDGSRIRVADSIATQDGSAVARASAVFLRQSSQPPGIIWMRTDVPMPPPGVDPAVPSIPHWGSDDSDRWTTDPIDHSNGSRKRTWQHAAPLFADQPGSTFARVAMVAESTSMLTNWGNSGIGFINTDLTMAISRRPQQDSGIGLEADNHISSGGIAVGTATLYDEQGMFGTVITAGVSSAARQIDSTKLQEAIQLPIRGGRASGIS